MGCGRALPLPQWLLPGWERLASPSVLSPALALAGGARSEQDFNAHIHTDDGVAVLVSM